jgi:hypothetical protein
MKKIQARHPTPMGVEHPVIKSAQIIVPCFFPSRFLGNAGYGTLIWVVTAEILPPKVRSIANSIIICFAFLCGFIIAKTFVDLLEGLQRSGTITIQILDMPGIQIVKLLQSAECFVFQMPFESQADLPSFQIVQYKFDPEALALFQSQALLSAIQMVKLYLILWQLAACDSNVQMFYQF